MCPDLRGLPSVSAHRFRGYREELAVRVYRPAPSTVPALVMLLHPGGFVGGGLDAIEPIAAALAIRLGVCVATPEYTLATRLPFPAAAEDVHAALVWASVNAGQQRWDARRMAIAGEESGGHLAAVGAMMARDRGGPALVAQVLVLPMLDPSLSSRSMRGVPVPIPPPHPHGACDACYRAYLPRAADRIHPYGAPASATRLGGLPPALILTAVNDPLRDEAEAYGARLIAAGVTTQVARLAAIDEDAGGGHRWSDDTYDAVEAFLAPRLARHTQNRTDPPGHSP